MELTGKILDRPALLDWRRRLREQGRRLAVTNGVFDILHPGHVLYLQAARGHADALLVGLTADRHVTALKGPGRPINSERDRAVVLAALQSVDAVHIFAEQDARAFLEAAQPDLYVKGGDYTLDTINQDERSLLEKMGVQIVLLPGAPGKSTSAILKLISNL